MFPTGPVTLYFDSFGVHAKYVVNTNTWKEYLTVGNVVAGVRFLNANTETLTTRYLHADHLGSISAITDENDNVVERLSSKRPRGRVVRGARRSKGPFYWPKSVAQSVVIRVGQEVAILGRTTSLFRVKSPCFRFQNSLFEFLGSSANQAETPETNR
jgi:hypothetical protein